ncbi:MAG TPA: c-type cytochrome [Gammaproteobacteria bacterium]|nr:c-type cytochrome [Gammaproteobacteria bacterium]
MLLATLIFVFLVPLPAIADEGTTSRHEEGRRIYNFRCYYCHGYSGDAKTLASSYLDPPPRDFTALAPDSLSREQMLDTLREGRPGTAMRSFRALLTAMEMERVVDFVRREFMRRKAPNSAYHTPENGWPDHQRYRAAFPFATGALPLDEALEELTPAQRRGRELYMRACISCHDRGKVIQEGAIWEADAVSYPRTGFATGDFLLPADAVSGASAFARHDQVPRVEGLTPSEREGEALFQANCAFCHGADGTGKNWIGSFLQPHPRDLSDPELLRRRTPGEVARAIAEGVDGTSMPAWKAVLTQQQIESLVSYIERVLQPGAPDRNRGR